MRSQRSRRRQQKGLRQNRTKTSVVKWSMFAIIVGLTSVISVYVVYASISLSTSVPYSQSFNGMGIPVSNPAPSNLPADFRLDTISAVRTVGVFGSAQATTARVAGANMSTAAANGSYNFGSGTATLGDADRAVGFIASGTATCITSRPQRGI